jgi:hypothetical protein
MRGFACLVTGLLLLAGPQISHSAGAIAVGHCAAYGYSYDYHRAAEARSAALGKCTGPDCKVVATIQKSCVAFAIDMRNSCGPHGYAVAARLGQAENSAVKTCYKYGGKDCVIRAWACDAKG